MTIDLKKFVTALKRTKNAECRVYESTANDNVLPYLCENVLAPMLDEKDVHLGDLDYDAFDIDDIYPLMEYAEEIEGIYQYFACFFSPAEAWTPVASFQPTFC